MLIKMSVFFTENIRGKKYIKYDMLPACHIVIFILAPVFKTSSSGVKLTLFKFQLQYVLAMRP